MIIKFLGKSYANGKTTGTNSIKSAIGYVLSNEDSTKTERSKEPEILKGNPAFVEQVGKECEHQHKYTSLVLSFRKEEKPTAEEQQKIIKQFESVAFSGLKEEEYTALWVKHEDKGRIELHCITPRVHIPTGKSLNIRPPGNQSYELYTALRDVINADMGYKEVVEDKTKIKPKLADYQQKNIAQGLAEEKGNFKNKLTDLLTKEIVAGTIKNRADLVGTLKEFGFEVVRQGEDYISIKNPTDPTGRNIRLKGGIYDKSNGVIGQHREKAGKEISRDRTATTEPTKPSIEQTREKLNRLVESRVQFNEKRFNPTKRHTEKTTNSVGSNINRGGLSLNDSYKSMVELSHNRREQETSKFSRVGFTQNQDRKSSPNNQHRGATSQTSRKSNNNKEVKNGETNSIREKADRGNRELGQATQSRATGNSQLNKSCEQLGKAGQQLGEANKSLDRASKQLEPATQSTALGSISGLESQLRAEQGKLTNAKSPLERLAIQTRIFELLAQLEKAKQQYQEEQKKQKRAIFR